MEPHQPAAYDLSSSKYDRLGQLKRHDSWEGEDQEEECNDTLDGGWGGMSTEGEDGHIEKYDDQPEGGESYKEEYIVGQVGTHSTKLIMGISHKICFLPDQLIIGNVWKEAYPQDNGNE